MFFKFLFLDDTIGNLFVLDIHVHIYLPQSLIDVKRPITTLSHFTTHRIDVYPYKRDLSKSIL